VNHGGITCLHFGAAVWDVEVLVSAGRQRRLADVSVVFPNQNQNTMEHGSLALLPAVPPPCPVLQTLFAAVAGSKQLRASWVLGGGKDGAAATPSPAPAAPSPVPGGNDGPAGGRREQREGRVGARAAASAAKKGVDASQSQQDYETAGLTCRALS